MKTKRFLLATSGSTVDGRNIDADMLTEMAESYDPKTYAARLNIEHIRGFTGDGPFRAYGDVVALEAEEVTVNFNGEDETRMGLYGIFEVTDDAKKLNKASQKMYPSIEIEPDFGGKGFAYLMGCALTDSPASIATERLEFKRDIPGMLTLSADEKGAAQLLELAGEGDDGDGDTGGDFISRFGAMLESKLSKFTGAKPADDAKGGDAKKGDKPDDGNSQFSVADLQPLLTDMGQSFAAELKKATDAFREEQDQFSIKLKKLEGKLEGTPASEHTKRPAAAGSNGKFAKTDC